MRTPPTENYYHYYRFYYYRHYYYYHYYFLSVEHAHATVYDDTPAYEW